MTTPPFALDAMLADALQQPIWTMDPVGAITYANPFLCGYTGLDLASFLGDGWIQVVHPDDVPPLSAILAELLPAGAAYTTEFRLRRADGLFRWYVASMTPVRAPDGTVGAWAGSAIDIDDRHRAEEELRAREARARGLVDDASDLVYALDLDGTITEVNPAVERLLGYRPEELRGRRIDELVAPDQLALTRGILAAKMAGEATSTYDLDILARDGRRVTFEINSRLVTVDEEPRSIHGIARDVTDRRAAAAEQRRQERQTRLTAVVASALASAEPLPRQLQRCAEALVDSVDASFARVWVVDDGGTSLTLRASAGLYTHLDGPHGRIEIGAELKIGRIAASRRPILTNAVVGDPEINDQAWAEREGMVAFAGYPLVVGDHLRGVMGLFARRPLDGATLELLGSIADVIAVGIDRADSGARRDASLLREQAARRDAEVAERRYRGLFEGVGDAILVADADGRYQDANAAGLALLGYDRAELLRMRTGELAVDRERAAGAIARLSADGRWRGEVALRRKNGSVVVVEIQATVVALPDGAVNITAMRGVSERRAMQRQQEEFLEAVSHDLRNPMSVVRAQAELITRRARREAAPDPAALERSVERIVVATHRMESQLDEFQDALRLRSGYAVNLRWAPTDIAALAERAVADAQAGTSQHRVELRSRVAELESVVDPLRLRRVLDNLLGNAVKYSPEGGPIELGLDRVERADGAWAVVTVRDEGVGVPAADLPQIFERYHRGSNVDGTVRGSGIGLAGARQIIEQLGGTIVAESAEGRGSTFTLSLPLRPVEEPTTPDGARPLAEGSPRPA